MCDGDKLLVLQDKNLVKMGKRLMEGVVPLYYEMKKAEPNILTPDSIYKGISLAFTAGNIGPLSNLITIVKNNNEEDREEADKVVKWLTMEVNFTIDGAKTLFFLTRPKEVDEIIKKHTKGKFPYFFMYAKDKDKSQVEPPNNSTMNRISQAIPNPVLKFSKAVSKFDYTMLMDRNCNPCINPDNPIVKAYDYWNQHQYLLSNDEEGGALRDDMYLYKRMRKEIVAKAETEDIAYIVNTLVQYLYTQRKASAKKTLWACFGDVILENLKRNLEGKGKICPICGKRFVPDKFNALTQITCSRECKLKQDSVTRRERCRGAFDA